MNQFTCKTCEDKGDCDEYSSQAVQDVSDRCGLTCHSSFSTEPTACICGLTDKECQERNRWMRDEVVDRVLDTLDKLIYTTMPGSSASNNDRFELGEAYAYKQVRFWIMGLKPAIDKKNQFIITSEELLEVKMLLEDCDDHTERLLEIVNTICSRNSYIKSEGALDITGAEGVQVQIKADGKVLWINTENGCVLRVCQIKNIEINDERTEG